MIALHSDIIAWVDLFPAVPPDTPLTLLCNSDIKCCIETVEKNKHKIGNTDCALLLQSPNCNSCAFWPRNWKVFWPLNSSMYIINTMFWAGFFFSDEMCLMMTFSHSLLFVNDLFCQWCHVSQWRNRSASVGFLMCASLTLHGVTLSEKIRSTTGSHLIREDHIHYMGSPYPRRSDPLPGIT